MPAAELDDWAMCCIHRIRVPRPMKETSNDARCLSAPYSCPNVSQANGEQSRRWDFIVFWERAAPGMNDNAHACFK